MSFDYTRTQLQQQHKAWREARTRLDGTRPAPPIIPISVPTPAIAVVPVTDPEPEAVSIPVVKDWQQIIGHPRIQEIQKAVCLKFIISKAELIGNKRIKRIVTPRHVAVALCRQLTQRSTPEIGRAFGGRDHTTTLYAITKMAPLVDSCFKKLPIDASVWDWVEKMFYELDITPVFKWSYKKNNRVRTIEGEERT